MYGEGLQVGTLPDPVRTPRGVRVPVPALVHGTRRNILYAPDSGLAGSQTHELALFVLS